MKVANIVLLNIQETFQAEVGSSVHVYCKLL